MSKTMFDDSDVRNRDPMSIDEFCRWANVARETAESEIAAGSLKVQKCGEMITLSDALRWQFRLPENIYPWGDDIDAHTPFGT